MALIQRTCLGCGIRDDHPKHVIGTVDGNSVAYHLDCHAASEGGCPSCAAQRDGAEDLRGAEFREHITSLGDDFHAELMASVNPALEGE